MWIASKARSSPSRIRVPAIRGLTDTRLGDGLCVIPNHKSNKFHASALDCVVEDFDFDYLMALETDVLALRPTWLQWFVDQMRPTDFAVGMWHHEQFVNPSCTLYRGDVLRKMGDWCLSHPDPNTLRWGPLFGKSAPLDNNLNLNENPAEVLNNIRGWIAGPFAEKRGWPAGTSLKEPPSGQHKGPGWYEPGQQLHHWAVERGHTYTVCYSLTTQVNNVPVQTFYGPQFVRDAIQYPPELEHMRRKPEEMEQERAIPQRQLEAVEMFDNAETVHLWGGTRALDILKHPVTCGFVKANTPGWLAREARFWRQVVPQDVQVVTLGLIRHYGLHTTGQGTPDVTERDREAAQFVRECYEHGGVTWR